MNYKTTESTKKNSRLFRTALYTCLMFLTSLSAVSQNNYTIKMNIKAEGLPPEFAAYAEQDITTYIKGDKYKSEQNGMMNSSVSYYDGKKMVSLIETMGTKIGYTATKAELETEDKNNKTSKPKIEYTSEKKMFAGYECNKVIITATDKDKQENKIILWVTNDIKYDHPEARKSAGGMIDMSELKGYPLGMEMSQNAQGMEMTIIMSTTEILTDTIDDSVFVPNTEGYNMMSYGEMLEKQKMMMKGR